MNEPTDRRAAALAWAARGFKVFPLLPGGKTPIDKGWYALASNDPETVERMWTDPAMGWARDYNIGVLTDDMIVVDIDQKGGKKGVQSYIELGLPLDTLLVRTPSGGFHAYFSGPNRSLSVGRLGDGLDIRSYHGFVIAPGSELCPGCIRGTDVPGAYTLVHDAPPRSAPAALLSRLDAPRDRTEQTAVVELDKPANVERAIEYSASVEAAVFGQGADAHTFLVACAMKDFGVSEETAFTLLDQHYLPRCVAPRTIDEQRAFLRRKVENAYRYGKTPAGAADPQLDFDGVDLAGVEQPPKAPILAGPGWYWHGDDWESEEDWLLEELLPETGVAVLTANSGDGKTFLALELARCVAQGQPFFGAAVEARGGTLYLTSESLRSVKTRMAALEGEKLPIATRYVSGLSDKAQLQAVVDELHQTGRRMLAGGVMPRLVVLDTLSASNLLLDENDNSEAAAAMSMLARLSQALHMLVLVVHHKPKEGKGARGAGAIYNSADYVLEIEREGKSAIRDLHLRKGRDAVERALGPFTLVPVTVGQTSKGKPVQTCIVSTAPPAQPQEAKETAHAAIFAECLDIALVADGEQIEGRLAVEVEEVEALFKDRKQGSRDRGAIKKAFREALEFAQSVGAVEHFVYMGRKYLIRREILQ